MKLTRILFLVASLVAGVQVQAAAARTFDAGVIAVLDGDTLLVSRAGKPVKLRLAEIDAPEVGHAGAAGKPSSPQPFGEESQQSLAELVTGKQVQVESRAVDNYGRIVAVVRINGLNVNHEQVRRGLAWEYTRFHSNKELMALQRDAQLAKRGLWSGEDNIEPALWRRQHPSSYAASASSVAKPSSNDCGNKRCDAFFSCAEAKRYFARCGGRQLDGDRDGRPCESLCAAEGTLRK